MTLDKTNEAPWNTSSLGCKAESGTIIMERDQDKDSLTTKSLNGHVIIKGQLETKY